MNEGTPAQDRRVLRRYGAEDRQRLIAQFKSSGQTAKAFCQVHRIHPRTLSGWMKKAGPSASGFAAVALPIGPAAPVEVDLPNGVRIRLGMGGDRGPVVELIRAVVALGSRRDGGC